MLQKNRFRNRFGVDSSKKFINQLNYLTEAKSSDDDNARVDFLLNSLLARRIAKLEIFLLFLGKYYWSCPAKVSSKRNNLQL